MHPKSFSSLSNFWVHITMRCPFLYYIVTLIRTSLIRRKKEAGLPLSDGNAVTYPERFNA